MSLGAEGSERGLPREAFDAVVRELHAAMNDFSRLSSDLSGGVVGEFEAAFSELVGARQDRVFAGCSASHFA